MHAPNENTQSMRYLSFSMAALCCLAAKGRETALPAPDTTAGMPVMEAFAKRQSTRQFDSRALSRQELSNLLWATMGMNRPETSRLTAPSCQNKQEIRLYVFTSDGAYEYIPATHSLDTVATGDHRALVAGRQDFVCEAPVSLVIVADMDRFGSTDARAMMMAAVDAGIVSENACLAASGLGLATVPRASMDTAAITTLLGLNERQIPLMNNPVGHFRTAE